MGSRREVIIYVGLGKVTVLAGATIRDIRDLSTISDFGGNLTVLMTDSD